ncbi:MAG: hypothetical protein QW776_05100 [Candidatus Nitrosocaldus sp.]
MEKRYITYEDYMQATIAERLELLKRYNVLVRCNRCKYEWLDDEERNIWNHDLFICKNCQTVITPKKHKVCISRDFTSKEEALNFLAREDLANDMEGEAILNLKFKGKHNLRAIFQALERIEQIDLYLIT